MNLESRVEELEKRLNTVHSLAEDIGEWLDKLVGQHLRTAEELRELERLKVEANRTTTPTEPRESAEAWAALRTFGAPLAERGQSESVAAVKNGSHDKRTTLPVSMVALEDVTFGCDETIRKFCERMVEICAKRQAEAVINRHRRQEDDWKARAETWETVLNTYGGQEVEF